MACPSTALINLNEDGNDGGEKVEEEEKKPVELLLANPQLRRSSEVMEEEDDGGKTPLRYIPLCDVYSATSPCVSSTSGGSKKVKPPHVHHHHHRKLQSHFSGCDSSAKDDQFLLASASGAVAGVVDGNVRVSDRGSAGEEKGKPPITKFYARRYKGKGKLKEVKIEKELKGKLGFDGWENLRSRSVNLGSGKGKEVEKLGNEEEHDELVGKKGKRKKLGGCELENLRLDSAAFSNDSLKFRGPRKNNFVHEDSSNKNCSVSNTNLVENCGKMRKRKQKGDLENEVENLGSLRKKRWMWYLFGFFHILFL